MPDVWYCLNGDCEARLIDCGDVWLCPRCRVHFTHAALAVHQDVLTGDDLGMLSAAELAVWMGQAS